MSTLKQIKKAIEIYEKYRNLDEFIAAEHDVVWLFPIVEEMTKEDENILDKECGLYKDTDLECWSCFC